MHASDRRGTSGQLPRNPASPAVLALQVAAGVENDRCAASAWLGNLQSSFKGRIFDPRMDLADFNDKVRAGAPGFPREETWPCAEVLCLSLRASSPYYLWIGQTQWHAFLLSCRRARGRRLPALLAALPGPLQHQRPQGARQVRGAAGAAAGAGEARAPRYVSHLC